MCVIFDYVLCGVLLLIFIVVGVVFGVLFFGMVFVELVFVWLGLGMYVYNFVVNFDLFGIMGVGFVVGVIYFFINFIVDLLYGVFDLRVRIV